MSADALVPERDGELPRLLVVGCGAIGGVLVSTLLEQGIPVTCVARRPDIAEAIRLRGLELRDEAGTRLVRGPVTVHEEPPASGSFDYVLLATQPNQVESAAQQVLPLLAPKGSLVCFQNGLCEERLAPMAGADRVIGAVIAWGASTPFPGVYERTSAGGFMLGRLDGIVDDRVMALARLLEAVGPVETTSNLSGVRWSKLAINCAISSLGTIGGDRLGALMVQRFVRRLALDVMTEAVVVARAYGVKLEKVSGTFDLEWLALTEAERTSATGSPSLFAKHTLLLAVGARYRRLRSSMLAAIERGREPPIDFLNGEVIERGRAKGIPTPVNEHVLAVVKAIARRNERPGMDTLKRVFDETR